MHRRFVRRLIPALLLLIAGVAATDADAGVEDQARGIVNAAGLTDATFAAYALDLDTGEVLLSVKPDVPVIPASNMKVITTAASLHILGPDFVFETELNLLDGGGDDDDGGKGATLVVRGDGDPAFGDPVMLKDYGGEINTVERMIDVWVNAVQDAGVKKVHRLIVDDRVFDRDFIHPSWPTNQLHKWYCAQVSGLNFYHNVFDVYAAPQTGGGSPAITIVPRTPGVHIVNRAATIRSGNASLGADRAQGGNTLSVHGKIKRKYGPIQVTMHDPATVFGNVLADRLRAAGVAVGGVERPTLGDDLSGGETLHKFRTPLSLVLARCNKPSRNLYGDALLKRMGRQYTGAPGSWKTGAAAVRAFLSERALKAGGAAVIDIADGSGMSRDNKVTVRALTEIYQYMHDGDPIIAEMFKQSLSIGGVDGTLKNRFKDFNGQVRGKSGWIARTSTLSGYLTLPGAGDGEERTVAFAIFLNNSPKSNLHNKPVQDRVLALIDKALAARVASQ